MGRVIMSGIVPKLEVPETGLKLADIAEGQIVKVNENGSPVEFYVAKHNYESGLNGAGRTLLVRKDCYTTGEWHNTNIAANYSYASSTIDYWFNYAYKAILDSAVQAAIGTTSFYCIASAANTAITSIARSVFALSVREFGLVGPAEGTALPTASALRDTGYYNGGVYNQWTRTLYNAGSSYQIYEGSASARSYSGLMAYRPCFTLPATVEFDEETLILKGVS